MIYVICRNRQVFTEFCIDVSVPIHNATFHNVRHADELRGTLHVPIILYADYYNHTDWDRIREILPTRNPVYLDVNYFLTKKKSP